MQPPVDEICRSAKSTCFLCFCSVLAGLKMSSMVNVLLLLRWEWTLQRQADNEPGIGSHKTALSIRVCRDEYFSMGLARHF